MNQLPGSFQGFKSYGVIAIRLILPFLGALLLGILFVACSGIPQAASNSGGGSQNKNQTFVGKVDGSDAFVALVTDGKSVTAYVCDSQEISEWFKGPVTGESVDLTSASGARLQATVKTASATGTFTPSGGSSLSFNTEPATAPAGLYRAEGTFDNQKYVGGWIALANGEQRGAVRPKVSLNVSSLDLSASSPSGINLSGSSTDMRMITPTFLLEPN